MKIFCRLILVSFFVNTLNSCVGNSIEKMIKYDQNNTTQMSLSPYHLPLCVNIPDETSIIGQHKVEVKSTFDGFIWKINKGDQFRFQIEELGNDNQIFKDRVNEMLSIKYFSEKVVVRTDSLLILKYPNVISSASFYILKITKLSNVYYLISTEEKGISNDLYMYMLNTIESINSDNIK